LAKAIMVMNFGGGLTQTEIGQRLRIPQMRVRGCEPMRSGHLRSRLLGRQDIPAPRR
jgi:DNA-directed RNA polymerase specialized sigma subunit